VRIGIDYRPAWAHAPGVGRYTRELVRALIQLPAPPELALFELGDPRREVDGAALGIAGSHAIVKRLAGPVPRRALHFFGRFGLGADQLLGGVELFQQTSRDPLRVRRARQCTAVAELPAPDSAGAEAHAAWLRSLDGVLVFSAHAAERLQRDCGVDPERIHNTPVGCEHWRRDLDASLAATQDIEQRPARLVALGALQSTRRPLVLLEALELLRAGGLDVELTHLGRDGDAAAEWQRRRSASPARDALHWNSAPSESDLPRLVAGSDVLVHLSHEELTPVTVLEACSLGPAVVADRLPALEEALGELGGWLDPGCTDARQLADRIAAALESSRDHAAREQRRALAERYDWRSCALATQLAWRRILSSLRAGA
jgi:glycosyltransferase involved in cell wall biosynthesis